MIHRLPTTSAHTAPTNEGKSFLEEVIMGKNFPHAVVQTKKDTLLGALTHHTLFQGKVISFVPQSSL
jgi:hypothetical protein